MFFWGKIEYFFGGKIYKNYKIFKKKLIPETDDSEV